jgi:hypothetical protein
MQQMHHQASSCGGRHVHGLPICKLPIGAQLEQAFCTQDSAAPTNQRAVARHRPPAASAIADRQGCSLAATCVANFTCSYATCAWQTACPT